MYIQVNCVNESAAAPMREVSDQYDGTRPVTENHIVGAVALRSLDIQGMSHRTVHWLPLVRLVTFFIAFAGATHGQLARPESDQTTGTTPP